MDCVEALDRHLLARRIPVVAGHRQSKIRHRIYEMQYLVGGDAAFEPRRLLRSRFHLRLSSLAISDVFPQKTRRSDVL